MKIKQGDAYAIPIEIKLNDAAVDVAEIESVEFCIGSVRKLYPGAVTYEASEGYFYMPLTQAETFAMEGDSAVQLDVRVKFEGGDVEGIEKPVFITVVSALSEEVL